MLRKFAPPAACGAAALSNGVLAPSRAGAANLRPLDAYGNAPTTSSALACHVFCVTHHTGVALHSSRRFYFQTSRIAHNDAAGPTATTATQQQQAPPASSASSTNAPPPPPRPPVQDNESALDVAMRVNTLKKQHQTGGAGANKKAVEQEAWQALNSLTEDQINSAEGKAVSLLLNSWAYFAKFWGKGKDGPA